MTLRSCPLLSANSRKCGVPGFLSGLPQEHWYDIVRHSSARHGVSPAREPDTGICFVHPREVSGREKHKYVRLGEDRGIAGSGDLSQGSPSGRYICPQQLCGEMWWWKRARFRYRGLKRQFGIYNSPKFIPGNSTKGQLVFFYCNTSEFRSCERAQHVESSLLFNLHSLQSSWVYLAAET